MNKTKRIIYISILLFLYCESPIEPDMISNTNIENAECTLSYGGRIDDCGICAGGTTGRIINDTKDICGICIPNPLESEETEDLQCGENSFFNGLGCVELLCSSNQGWNGSECVSLWDGDESYLLFYDSNGDLNNDRFCGCTGTFGNATLNTSEDQSSNPCCGNDLRDDCGICDGPGILDGECDCNGSILDCNNVCNGDNTDWDSDGLCDNDMDNDDIDEDQDDDNDGILDINDSCEKGVLNWVSNSTTDFDSDGCQDSSEDSDDDNDGVLDEDDQCKTVDYNLDSDIDNDGCDDNDEDSDDDGDLIIDNEDSCPTGETNWISDNLTDHDSDGCKDLSEEDTDDDNDGVEDNVDDCSLGNLEWTSNENTDYDSDGCQDLSEEDLDDDDDGILDENDNCLMSALDWDSTSSTETVLGSDHDQDGCDDENEDNDDDNDGIADDADTCDPESNIISSLGWTSESNTDFDNDGCQNFIEDSDNDNDGVDNDIDQCLTADFTLATDSDADGCDDEDEDTCIGFTIDCSGECNGNSTEDQCGVCDGDNSTCEDCAGVPNGEAIIDVCGICDGPGILDGKCDCDGNTIDDCGVCGGDGIAEGLCDCNGNAEDNCGICGGDDSPNTGICDCTGTPNGDSQIDCTGECGGNAILDDCDVCNGDNSTCTDCNGVVNGFSVLDECGVCNGPGANTDEISIDGNCYKKNNLDFIQDLINDSIADSLIITIEDSNDDGYTDGIQNIGTQIWNDSFMLEFLHLQNVGFTCAIPISIENLTALESLNLSNNNLINELTALPEETENLTLLSYLDLSNNQFMGEIPEVITELVNLTTLNVSNNLFDSGLDYINQIEILYLSNNSFMGSLPSASQLGGSLTTLHLDNNYFGCFNYDFINDVCLEYCDSDNGCTNSIPYNEYELGRLQFLDLHNNYISGELPLLLPTELSDLQIQNNQISGIISNSICNSIITINGSGNNFCPETFDCNFFDPINYPDVDCVPDCIDGVFENEGDQYTCDCVGSSGTDCNATCDGTAYFNDCGICSGGLTDCGGIVCPDNQGKDECGVCYGNNEDIDFCNVCFGENISCNQGILTKQKWNLNEITIGPAESECNNESSYTYVDYFCLSNEALCYDFEYTFNENLSFTFDILTWWPESNIQNQTKISHEGVWSLNTLITEPYIVNGDNLCVDFNDENIEDICFDAFNVLNEYEDYQAQGTNCADVDNSGICDDLQNTITLVNNTAESCKIEKYVTQTSDVLFSNNPMIDDINTLPQFVKNLIINNNE